MTAHVEKYKVSVNGFEYFIAKEELGNLDIISRSAGNYHLVKNNHSVNGRIVTASIDRGEVEVEINGKVFNVIVKDELAQQLEKMGFGTSSAKEVKEIKAPMPGLVLQVHAAEGQAVSPGDKILILEAMKMENSIIIHTNATIKKIHVVTGQAVEKGQLLVELE